MSDIFTCHRKIQLFASLITFNSKNVEDNRHAYEGEDAFLWLRTSFGKSVRHDVLSFACLTMNKARYVLTGWGSCRYLFSLAVGVTYNCQI